MVLYEENGGQASNNDISSSILIIFYSAKKYISFSREIARMIQKRSITKEKERDKTY